MILGFITGLLVGIIFLLIEIYVVLKRKVTIDHIEKIRIKQKGHIIKQTDPITSVNKLLND